MLKHFYSKYGGIIIGGFYGLLMRIGFGISFNNSKFDFADLFSITFIWIVPIVVGLTPLIFASKDRLEDIGYRLFSPVFSVLFFFILCFWSGHEDIICIFILSIPFLIGAAIAGLLFGKFVLTYRKKRGILFSIYFLPFLFGLYEPQIENTTQKYQVTSSVIISAKSEKIWKNIVSVYKIENKEYPKGLFNYAGIPRPIYAEVSKDILGGIRVGNFEGGLKFRENIIRHLKNRLIEFDIEIIPSNKQMTIFERHMLKGKHFRFINATYELEQVDKNKVRLSLTTNYQLETNINSYGQIWGQLLLSDFQERLLYVVKNRCEAIKKI